MTAVATKVSAEELERIPKWLARLECGHLLSRTTGLLLVAPVHDEQRHCFLCKKDGQLRRVLDVVTTEPLRDRYGRT